MITTLSLNHEGFLKKLKTFLSLRQNICNDVNIQSERLSAVIDLLDMYEEH